MIFEHIRLIYFSLFLFLIFILFNTACNHNNKRGEDLFPSVENNEVFIPIFHKDIAFDYLLTQVEFGPRNPGSMGHQQCLQFLTMEMQRLADSVYVQYFTHIGYQGRAYRMANIFASFNKEAEFRILLGAHWDTRPRAERDPDPTKRDEPILGANDGGSGVAVLLELARIMKEFTPPFGVDIIFFDGEDYGKEGDLDQYSIGAKYFARNLPAGYNPQFGIIVDMIGDKDSRFPKEEYSRRYAPRVVDLIWSTAQNLGIDRFEERTGQVIYDDHIPLIHAGIPTALIIDLDLIGYDGPDIRRRYWHTTLDTPDQCSPESLGAVGILLTHIIYGRRP